LRRVAKADYRLRRAIRATLESDVKSYFGDAPTNELVTRTTLKKGHGRIETLPDRHCPGEPATRHVSESLYEPRPGEPPPHGDLAAPVLDDQMKLVLRISVPIAHPSAVTFWWDGIFGFKLGDSLRPDQSPDRGRHPISGATGEA